MSNIELVYFEQEIEKIEAKAYEQIGREYVANCLDDIEIMFYMNPIDLKKYKEYWKKVHKTCLNCIGNVDECICEKEQTNEQ